MKNKIIIKIIIVLFIIKTNAQENKFSIEVNYPLSIDNNFIGENYNPIIDFGIKYRFAETKIINFGVGVNVGFFANPEDKTPVGIKTNATFIQPKAFTEFIISTLEKLRPSIGIGYTFANFKTSFSDNFNIDGSSTSSSEGGFGLNLGVTYDIVEHLFINAQYDYTKLSIAEDVPDTTFNTNMNLIKLGLGYRF